MSAHRDPLTGEELVTVAGITTSKKAAQAAGLLTEDEVDAIKQAGQDKAREFLRQASMMPKPATRGSASQLLLTLGIADSSKLQRGPLAPNSPRRKS